MLLRRLLLVGLASAVLAKVQFLGVAISGGDFGCQIDGTCPISSAQLPSDGAGQMQHFVNDDGLNLMRLPISWQFLVNNQLGGSLDSTNFGKYDQLVQSCLATGAYCMVEIHNFARWNGGIIGQGGPTDDQFVSLWTQLATKYAQNNKVVFELMNEPHDLDVGLWAQTCQKVVTAIRGTGATSQMILLAGDNFDSAATLVSDGSAAAMMGITNPDGSTDNLILDIHKYLDVDNSGTHAQCVTDNVDAFTNVAAFLRQTGRKGLISETGASNDATCFTNFCSQNAFLNANSDVFLGYVGWGAGSFSSSYLLSLTPTKQNGKYVDTNLMTQCVIGPWLNSNSSAAAPATSSVVLHTATATATPTTATSTHSTAMKATGSVMVLSMTSLATPITTLMGAPTTGLPTTRDLSAQLSALQTGYHTTMTRSTVSNATSTRAGSSATAAPATAGADGVASSKLVFLTVVAAAVTLLL